MRIYLVLMFVLVLNAAHGQHAIIHGKVADKSTQEPLPGVNVLYGTGKGVATDNYGMYRIETDAGKIRLHYRFVGYQPIHRVVELAPGQKIRIDILLEPQSHLLDEVVVSASRYEQRLSDVIVSMEVIDQARIEKTHTLSVESAIQQMPGIMFLENQISIRGGNSYSYGVGSRVLLLLDDLPMLTGAGGQAKWNFIPIENLSSIEVLKGASSALYGSSALNGVINIRTAFPGVEPETSLVFFSGMYGSPRRPEAKWWGNTQPFYSGIRLSHSRQAGNLDLVAGANIFTDQGFRENQEEQFYRLNLNTRYRIRQIEGLSVGINSNMMRNRGGNFLLWLNGTDGIYRASPDFNQRFDNMQFNIDPFVTYHTRNNQRHSLRGRIFQVNYDNDTLRDNFDNSYYIEYQFFKGSNENFSFTAGGSALYVVSRSTFYGDTRHSSNNQSLFMQAEHRFGRLRLTLGGRYEWHTINQSRQRPMPLLRFGMNYQAGRATFIRSSFGQGFRYPTIAEKYASTQVGALRIFPNTALKPERGWNAEAGVKQGFSFQGVQGFFDAALFLTEFENMIEFTFGQHYPDTLLNPTMIDFFRYTGFKPYNISNARISGFEVSATGQGNIGAFDFRFHAGYTYTNPVDKDFDTRLPEENTGTSDRNILKYRFVHSAKASVDFSWRQFSAGLNADYHSFIINIDRAFEDSLRFPNGVPFGVILPGLQEYRRINNTGEILFNFRLAYEPAEHIRWSFIVNNVLNNEHMTRPAYVGPPRVYAVQLSMRF